MGQLMLKLDKIERDVASLKTKFDEISGKTKILEGVVQGHTTVIDELKASMSEIKSSEQQHGTAIEQLWMFSNDVATKADQRIREIKQAIQGNITKIEQIGVLQPKLIKQ